MKSTTTLLFFKQQKIEFGDAISIFLTFHLFIFFCSSSFFCLQSSTEDYKHIHVIFSNDFLFFLSKPFFFWFLNRTGMVLYVFYWDLMVSWLHLMFQVFKCFKWRVQPQTSFLTSKKSSLAMLYLFFWAFCSSSSFVLLLFFFSRYPFFLCFLKLIGMFLYFLFSVVFDFWLHLKFEFF